ncbi:hypothetical protein T11_7892 [Trichinella zimbabwensis]|uniref:Uncharacterized protein n=1 Tax=Trichinella zimbabwensis TaxID=268475 RepID=A0A0V1I9A0_9BILA|nr:hypothetical protein T11_7892 [Trichinella zimbabwensis]
MEALKTVPEWYQQMFPVHISLSSAKRFSLLPAVRSAPHADNCTPDNSILYKMEKNNLKRRAGKEMKPVSQIYSEEASSASTDLKTAEAGTKRFAQLPSTRQQLE